jgi:hypothetical protein
LRKYAFTISVRLSKEDKQRYERLLRRFGSGFSRSKSDRFRALLARLDFPYETRWDNEGYDDLPEVSQAAESSALGPGGAFLE